jgi:hypothetical protein
MMILDIFQILKHRRNKTNAHTMQTNSGVSDQTTKGGIEKGSAKIPTQDFLVSQKYQTLMDEIDQNIMRGSHGA